MSERTLLELLCGEGADAKTLGLGGMGLLAAGPLSQAISFYTLILWLHHRKHMRPLGRSGLPLS